MLSNARAVGDLYIASIGPPSFDPQSPLPETKSTSPEESILEILWEPFSIINISFPALLNANPEGLEKPTFILFPVLLNQSYSPFPA